MVQLVPANPLGNGWVGSPDPFSIIGDSNWTDVCATASAAFDPPPPPPAAAAALPHYAQVCARIGESHFNGGGSVEPALCLLLAANGTWFARQHAAVLANGTLLTEAAAAGSEPGAGFDPTRPRVLSVCVRNATFSGSADGAPLFSVEAPGAGRGGYMAAGRVALGSGYHGAAFDDFAVVQAPLPPGHWQPT